MRMGIAWHPARAVLGRGMRVLLDPFAKFKDAPDLLSGPDPFDLLFWAQLEETILLASLRFLRGLRNLRGEKSGLAGRDPRHIFGDSRRARHSGILCYLTRR